MATTEARIGSWGWRNKVLKELESGAQEVALVASGWRARAVDRHLDALTSSDVDYLFRDLILLFGFTMVYFFARGQGLNASRREWLDKKSLRVIFTRGDSEARNTDSV